MAEVLITLAIIGVVAALTIPSVVKNYQETVLKTQFKKTYSTLQRGITQTQVDMGYKPDCYLWDKNPYGGSVCAERNPSTGYCIKYTMSDGSARPSDIDGPSRDCVAFKEQLRKTLNVGKLCTNKALAGGCVPDYKGLDMVYKDNNEGATDYDAGGFCDNGNWSKNTIENNKEVWVLADGTIIMQGWRPPVVLAVDINGYKKPNRWGYDIFPFYVRGNLNSPLKLMPSTSVNVVEKGGYTTTNMMKHALK